MDKELQRIVRHCKMNDQMAKTGSPLQEVIATQLTEELMDKFQITQEKRKKLRDLQAEFTRKCKLKEFKTRLQPLYQQVPRLNQSHKEIRSFAHKGPSSEMSSLLEFSIRNRVCARGLEVKYTKIIENIMADAKVEFVTITHKIGVNLKTKPMKSASERFSIEPYKYLGKTENYSTYLRTRRELGRKFMLHQPLVQKIFRTCVNSLPDKLFNLGVLRQKPNEVRELENSFNHFITEAENVLNKFYYAVVEIVEADDTKAESPVYGKIMKVCTGLLGVYIGKAVSETIRYIAEVTGNPNLIPYMKLSLKYSNILMLFPNEQDLILMYNLFITKLVDVCQNFSVLEMVRIRDYPPKTIHINISGEFIVDAIETVGSNIMNMYEPVQKYMVSLEEGYREVFTAVSLSSLQSETEFEEGATQIRHFQNYINKTSSLLTSEYFAVGQLILSEYVQTMKESLSEVIETIFVSLCGILTAENESICESFEKMKNEAMRKPLTSEELIEQGKYMVWVKSDHLIELKQRIQVMLQCLTSLMEFGTVSKEFMALNAATVNWVRDIEPILDYNSSMYEALKFEYEEKLQRTVAFVHESVAELFPLLTVLNDMDDFSRAREYVDKVKVFMLKLRELRTKIGWINKEQLNLGFKVSTFENVEEVEVFIYPFFHLLKVCMNIQRHINVWLDGQFEFLKIEETEDKVDEYMKELLKMQKTYRMKLRQQQADNSRLRFFGVLDDPDLFSWPAPLKLTALAIQRLKDFRPAMTLMRIMCNDALEKRHWKDMSMIAGFDLTPNAGTSLKKLTMMGLEPDLDQYDVISSGATKERELYRNLTKMKNEWNEIFFKTSTFKDTGIVILTALDDIQVVLDDHILKALTMRGSIFAKPYEVEVKGFYEKLVRINKTIDEWGKVQSQWLYLLPIFSSRDIVAQMPEEGALFKEVFRFVSCGFVSH